VHPFLITRNYCHSRSTHFLSIAETIFSILTMIHKMRNAHFMTCQPFLYASSLEYYLFYRTPSQSPVPHGTVPSFPIPTAPSLRSGPFHLLATPSSHSVWAHSRFLGFLCIGFALGHSLTRTTLRVPSVVSPGNTFPVTLPTAPLHPFHGNPTEHMQNPDIARSSRDRGSCEDSPRESSTVPAEREATL